MCSATEQTLTRRQQVTMLALPVHATIQSAVSSFLRFAPPMERERNRFWLLLLCIDFIKYAYRLDINFSICISCDVHAYARRACIWTDARLKYADHRDGRNRVRTCARAYVVRTSVLAESTRLSWLGSRKIKFNVLAQMKLRLAR